MVVLRIRLQMRVEVVDTLRQKRDLHFGRPRVAVVSLVLVDDACLFFLIHSCLSSMDFYSRDTKSGEENRTALYAYRDNFTIFRSECKLFKGIICAFLRESRPSCRYTFSDLWARRTVRCGLRRISPFYSRRLRRTQRYR